MFEDKLPIILRNAVRELSETHILKNWCIDSNSCCTTVILKWTSPFASERADASVSPSFLPHARSHKSPAKRKKDCQRYETFKHRLNRYDQRQRTMELPSDSSADSAIFPAIPEMNCSQSACTGTSSGESTVSHSAPVIFAQSAMKLVVTDTKAQKETERKPISSSPESQASGNEPSTSKTECNALPKAETHGKNVQCALEGLMFVETRDTCEMLRQLKSTHGVEMLVPAWCDACAEPLSSWEVCSACAGVTYCSDCFSRTEHSRHSSASATNVSFFDRKRALQKLDNRTRRSRGTMTSAALDRVDRQELLRDEMADQSLWTEPQASEMLLQQQEYQDHRQDQHQDHQQQQQEQQQHQQQQLLQQQQQQEDQASQNPNKSADRSRPLLREKVGSLGRQLKQRLLRHQLWGKKNYDQLT